MRKKGLENLKQIKQELNKTSMENHIENEEIMYKPDLEVVYIYGKTGIGKSKLVYDTLETLEKVDIVYFSSPYWLGVNFISPAETCWLDNFYDSEMSMNQFIKLVDCYTKQYMRVKCCPLWLNIYKKIYITSLKSPREIYKGKLPEKILNRMKIIHME